MRSLGSDNHSGVHPIILESILKANENHAPAYGTEDLSAQLSKKIKSLFGEDWDSFHCFNGTAANVLCLKALVQSYHSVICSEVAHLNVDECGAPEFHLGSKLIPLPHQNGKISETDIEKQLIRLGDQHFSQVKAVSLTQPTELGTCYTLEELSEISKFCKKHDLFLHIDGARLANSLVHLSCSFKDIAQYADAISFGGTKNGLLGSELVLIKNQYAKNFKFWRKQLMQLPSKTRFLAAQFLAYLEDELYLKIAQHSYSKAKELEKFLSKHFSINYPQESNAVFVNLPKKSVKPLRKHLFFYVWDAHTTEVRLMTSFNTSSKDLSLFFETFKTHALPLLNQKDSL